MATLVSGQTLNATNFSLSASVSWNSGSGQSGRFAVYVISMVSEDDNQVSQTISDLEHDGTPATKAVEITGTNSSEITTTTSIWYLEDPPTGTTNVTYEVDNSTEVGNTRTVFLLYEDADSGTVADVVNSVRDDDGGTSIETLSLTSTVDNGFGVACISVSPRVSNQVRVTFASPLTELVDVSVGGGTGQLGTGVAHQEDTGTAGARDYSVTPAEANGGYTFAAVIFAAPSGVTPTAVGQATETDTALAAAHSKTVAVGLAEETDTAQAVAHSKTVAVGLAEETDTAQAVAHSKTLSVGQATETDSGQAITIQQSQLVSVGQATETDTAQAVAHSKTLSVGQAEETDTGQAITILQSQVVSVGLATETDTALAAAPIQGASTILVGQAEETDSAQLVGITHDASYTSLTSTFTSIDGTVTDQAEMVSLTFTTTDILANIYQAIGQATETDSALAAAAVQGAATLAVGQAEETDTAQAVALSKSVSVGQASETDTAQAIANSKTVAVGQATETDTAQASTPVRLVDVGQATEADSALEVTQFASQTVDVGQATETDTAQAIVAIADITVAVGQALEADTAGTVIALSNTQVTLLDEWEEVSTLITNGGTFDVSSGNGKRYLVARTSSAGGTLRSVTVLQYGGVEMTLAAEEVTTSGRDLQTAIWVLGEAGIDAAVDNAFTITTDNTEASQFRLQVACYDNTNQVTTPFDSFDVSATGSATPTPEALSTTPGGVVVVAAGANFGTSDDPDVDVTYSNLTERLESAGTQSYAGIADALADGSDFTPSATYVDTSVGHMVAISIGVGTINLGIGQAEETDTAQAVAKTRRYTAGQAAEIDTARPVTPAAVGITVAVGQATETDTAGAVAVVLPGRIAVGIAAETNTALSTTAIRSRTVSIGQATETDTAQAIDHSKLLRVFQATETDTALTIVGQEDVTELRRRQAEAGSAMFGYDRLLQASEVEAMRQNRSRMIRDRANRELMSIIPALFSYLLRR